jgi:hypothetical protein
VGTERIPLVRGELHSRESLEHIEFKRIVDSHESDAQPTEVLLCIGDA